MPDNYRGTIVKESLKDGTILKSLKVTGHRIVGRPRDSWDLVSVEVSLEDLAKLKYYINDGPWYAHFWNDNELIIVFKDKIFTDVQSAMEYGMSIGIPLEQLDFIKE
jgi:hypothetical protein